MRTASTVAQRQPGHAATPLARCATALFSVRPSLRLAGRGCTASRGRTTFRRSPSLLIQTAPAADENFASTATLRCPSSAASTHGVHSAAACRRAFTFPTAIPQVSRDVDVECEGVPPCPCAETFPSSPLSLGQGRRWPLVVFLNGRGTCGNLALWNFQLHGLRHWYGFLLLMPDSVRHAKGRFWCTPVDMLHAPDACGGSDDDAYIWSLVEEVRSDYEISDVIIMGWSNGAGLATTMACNHASDLLGAIVVAGGDAHTYAIPDHPSYSRGCQPDGPVHMLYLHDPNDLIVHYSNAVANVEHAANASGCDTSVCPAPQRRLDLVRHLEGVQRVGGDILNLGPRPRMETTLFAYRHCLPGGSAEMMVLMGYGSATSWCGSGSSHRPQLPSSPATTWAQVPVGANQPWDDLVLLLARSWPHPRLWSAK